LVVMNDGDVAALAGGLSLGCKGMLSVAMDASEAAGYMDLQGRVLGWLNELAFVPVDLNPTAAADEWSGDRGTGMMYFSRQAVSRLMPSAGISLARKKTPTDRFEAVQALLRRGDRRAIKIYETIGVYLGYALAHCSDFYDYHDSLILGSVTEGKAGGIVLAKARTVLKSAFPELADKIRLRLPEEQRRPIPLAMAAASLPSLRE